MKDRPLSNDHPFSNYGLVPPWLKLIHNTFSGNIYGLLLIGYEYRGGTCRDINECAMNVSKCFDDAICENNDGGYTCKCPSGFGDAIK